MAIHDFDERINKLPVWARQYIHHLATQADPQGDIRDLVYLKQERNALIKTIAELKQQVTRLERKAIHKE
jgi:hypothetical protein